MNEALEHDGIGARSAYLIPWLERLEMISLKQLSEAIEKKDEAAQQAELDMVRGAITRLRGVLGVRRRETGTEERQADRRFECIRLGG